MADDPSNAFYSRLYMAGTLNVRIYYACEKKKPCLPTEDPFIFTDKVEKGIITDLVIWAKIDDFKVD